MFFTKYNLLKVVSPEFTVILLFDIKLLQYYFLPVYISSDAKLNKNMQVFPYLFAFIKRYH